MAGLGVHGVQGVAGVAEAQDLSELGARRDAVGEARDRGVARAGGVHAVDAPSSLSLGLTR